MHMFIKATIIKQSFGRTILSYLVYIIEYNIAGNKCISQLVFYACAVRHRTTSNTKVAMFSYIYKLFFIKQYMFDKIWSFIHLMTLSVTFKSIKCTAHSIIRSYKCM